MKKRIMMAISIMVICILLSLEINAKVTNIGYNTTYTKGSITLYIKDVTTGVMTTGVLTIKRSNTISYNNMLKNPSTWYCSLDIVGDNYHNLRLNQDTVTTKVDGSDEYLVLNFSLSYMQHENNELKQAYPQENNWDYRLNFHEYTKYDYQGVYSIPYGLVDKDTERTINWQISAPQLGLITSSNKLYTGVSCVIEYDRPSYKVSFVDGEGKVIEEQTVLRGDNAKKPKDPSKEGYYFGGWDKSFLNVKENLTVSPKWVSKDGSNPPIAGDDALSVHMDLYDEAQTFYVPNVDTELINPNIE